MQEIKYLQEDFDLCTGCAEQVAAQLSVNRSSDIEAVEEHEKHCDCGCHRGK